MWICVRSLVCIFSSGLGQGADAVALAIVWGTIGRLVNNPSIGQNFVEPGYGIPCALAELSVDVGRGHEEFRPCSSRGFLISWASRMVWIVERSILVRVLLWFDLRQSEPIRLRHIQRGSACLSRGRPESPRASRWAGG